MTQWDIRTSVPFLVATCSLTDASFDTIKVRLQTTEKAQFKGPLDCLLQTVRNEGVKGLYKGATPPLVGWMFMDSIMLGSLTFYRRILNDNVFSNPQIFALTPAAIQNTGEARTQAATTLPAIGHGIAGVMAGATVSFIAAPVEHIKARLQIQYAVDKSKRLYSGPIDCSKKIYKFGRFESVINRAGNQYLAHGIRGLYHGLSATLLFRSFFFFWWASYDLISQSLRTHTSLSTPAINFWAGGLSAQIFWVTSYPSDVVKQRIMTDALGPPLAGGERRLHGWRDAAKAVWRENGWKGYWRGFVPCFLRAFPANAMALVAFEAVMRTLPE
ncbi:mitochondrial carrier [Lasallia pustulata]|uniref:Mitochondrial carrier n=1 Tax=Lasallia pustulata TaxID=136370 RepID=A0A1W5D7R8_9LECA|nr:mitochondrial carrier [Lasallia pustulata]